MPSGHVKISSIMKLPHLNTLLAFLSACQTTMGDNKVPDEGLHTTMVMLFAGFQGVVGMMWFVTVVLPKSSPADNSFLKDHPRQRCSRCC